MRRRKNPSLSTWLLLGGAALGAWWLLGRKKMTFMQMKPVVKAAPTPGAPKAGQRYVEQFFNKGKESVCYDTVDRKYVEDDMCKLEGW